MSHEAVPAPDRSVATPAERPTIPIVIGVVGHRDIRPVDVPALESALERVLTEFEQAYRNSPLVVMTSLAQGADILAARVAKRMAERGHKVAIRAPLPMPPDAYRESTSFDTDKDRQEFERWKGDATVELFQVPMPPSAGKPPGGWGEVARGQGDQQKTYRSQAYANAGSYLVLHCHVLVAFWDGKDADPKRPSGTAEHVLMKLLGRAQDRLPKSDEEPLGFRGERGPVIILKTLRAKSDSSERPDPDAGRREVRTPITILNKEKESPPPGAEVHSLGDVALAGEAAGHRFFKRVQTSLGSPLSHRAREADALAWSEVRQFRNICQAIDDFNGEVNGIPEDRWKRRSANAAVITRLFTTEPFGAWARRISAVREAAAELSNPLSQRLDKLQKWLFLVLGVSLLLFHCYAHPMDFSLRNAREHSVWFLGLSLLLLLGAMLMILRNWYSRVDERRLDYRVLAEAFRVRLMWSAAGIGHSVASSYPGQLRSEVAWVRQTLRFVCPPSLLWKEWFEGLPEEEKRLECLETVKDKWVWDQKKFHIDSHGKEHWWLPRCRAGGFTLAVLGWFGLFFIFWFAAGHPSNWALVACSMLVIAGGLLVAFCERRAHEDLSKQYERMTLVFDSGLRELEDRLKRHDTKGAQSIIEALGREAVAENANWVILRRSRPLELHIG